MSKEIALSLRRPERLSDEDLGEILSRENPFGELIKPQEASLVFIEDEEKSRSLEILFALTWDRPEQLPSRRDDLVEHRPRRLAFRVEDYYLVRFAVDILRRLAPDLLKK